LAAGFSILAEGRRFSQTLRDTALLLLMAIHFRKMLKRSVGIFKRYKRMVKTRKLNAYSLIKLSCF
jgi:hypothetical protein